MKGKKILVLAALIFLVVMVSATVIYRLLGSGLAAGQLAPAGVSQGPVGSGDPEASATPEAVQAPDFTVYDGQGQPVRLSDYEGKPVVLNFWASWCPPCKSEMPDFHEAYQQLGNEVQFLMVNATDGSRETVDTATSFIEEQGYTFPVLFDTQSEAAMAYGAYALPTTFFINGQGQVAAYAQGAIDADTLQRGIEMIHPGT